MTIMSYPQLSTVFVTFAVVFLVSRIINYFRCLKKTAYLPGIRSLVAPMSAWGSILPTCRSNPGLNWQWEWRKDVPYLFGDPAIYTCSLEVARQFLSTQGEFYKNPEFTEITTVWGPNLFAANGDEWKRFRRIVTPAFETVTYSALWNEGTRIFDEMISVEGWAASPTVDIQTVSGLTNKFALILISSIGFGRSISWDHDKTKTSTKMTFGEALTVLSHDHLLRLILPKWAYSLPIKKFRDLDNAAATALAFMHDMIRTRRKELSSGAPLRKDILSLMIRSAGNDDPKMSMTDEELVGNTFILLFAGHETTAMTLNAALGFMALHPQYQEEMYEEIKTIMPNGADFTFDNSSKLLKVQACFLEAARMFPAVFMWIRETFQDVVLEHVGPNRDERIMIPSGTRCVVDAVGMHYNARLFADPDVFRPERWYGAHENTMTMFSVGKRACIGRRFSITEGVCFLARLPCESTNLLRVTDTKALRSGIGRRFSITEGVCFLARLLRDWRVEPLMHDAETAAQWERRCMRARALMSFGVDGVCVRLVRRG